MRQPLQHTTQLVAGTTRSVSWLPGEDITNNSTRHFRSAATLRARLADHRVAAGCSMSRPFPGSNARMANQAGSPTLQRRQPSPAGSKITRRLLGVLPTNKLGSAGTLPDTGWASQALGILPSVHSSERRDYRHAMLPGSAACLRFNHATPDYGLPFGRRLDSHARAGRAAGLSGGWNKAAHRAGDPRARGASNWYAIGVTLSNTTQHGTESPTPFTASRDDTVTSAGAGVNSSQIMRVVLSA